MFTLAGVGRYDAKTCSGSLDSWCTSITCASERSWWSSASSRRRSSRSGSAHRNSTAIAAKTTSLMVLSISGSQSKDCAGALVRGVRHDEHQREHRRDHDDRADDRARPAGSGVPGPPSSSVSPVHREDEPLELARDLAQPARRVEARIDPLAQPGHGLREPRALELAVRRHAASVPCLAVS